MRMGPMPGILAALMIVLGAGAFFWPRTPVPATAPGSKATLKDSWEGRSLTFRPDGCVELRANHGFRSFIFQDRRWRECPRKP